MRYGSVCSGIEAATMAWHSLGWVPFFSEIEAFPRAVLEHHHPEVPVHGDFTTIERISMDQLTFLSEEPRVNPSASQDSERIG